MNAPIYAECHAEGGMTRHSYARDPKHLAFVLARYKFVAKMLAWQRNVLEVGCGDGFASRIVAQSVGRLVAVDLDDDSIAEARRERSMFPVEYLVHDMLQAPLHGFTAAYALDVLEHIQPADEARFLANLRDSAPLAVIGMPSLESQKHAGELSRAGHVNCKSGDDLRCTLAGYFGNVFLFSMNDEVVHTGFYPMAHYLLALCVGRR